MADHVDIFWHPGVLNHDMGQVEFEVDPSGLLEALEDHIEGPRRIRNIRSILERGPLAPYCRWHKGRMAEEAELLTFHTPQHISGLKSAAAAGGKWYTRTTRFTADSYTPVCVAAGTALAAADHVIDGHGRISYALIRPPGHHAAPDCADGYCFINNTALAAERAIRGGVNRVAIIDWDVHHGNGTQAGFYHRNDVLTVSMHMDHGAWGASHPQTGKADEIGEFDGHGYNLNVPLPMGSGDQTYQLAFEQLVIPAIDHFKPELMVVANGQDANQFDPNGRQMLTMAGFKWLAQATRALAERHTGGRMVVVQEGGYQASYVAYCAHGVMEGLLGLAQTLPDPIAFYPEDPRHGLAVAEITASRKAALEAAVQPRS